MLATTHDMAWEHAQVTPDRDDWHLENMTSCAALFAAPRTNLANGDKLIGTHHRLPTRRAGHHADALRNGKLLKTLSCRRTPSDATAGIGASGPRLSRLEGLVGPAGHCNIRLHSNSGRNALRDKAPE